RSRGCTPKLRDANPAFSARRGADSFYAAPAIPRDWRKPWPRIWHAAGGWKVAFQQHLQRLWCTHDLLREQPCPALLDGSLLLWTSTTITSLVTRSTARGGAAGAICRSARRARRLSSSSTATCERLAEQLRDLPKRGGVGGEFIQRTITHLTDLMSEVFFSNSQPPGPAPDSRA
uniref:NR LBD domain-containing protein n=1 Tax=Macrostomum lignano TaxID=282301 RepID=A0A1I8FNP8_9PLAT